MTGHTTQTSPTLPRVGITRSSGWVHPSRPSGPLLLPLPQIPPATHPGVPSEPFHMHLTVYSRTHLPPKHPITSLFDGGAPAFPGTMSWFDMARLPTTLTTASRLTLAPLTWTWPCSIEMLVEVGAWPREEGGRGSLHHSSFFCPKLGAAADYAGVSSPEVTAPGSIYPPRPGSPGKSQPFCPYPYSKLSPQGPSPLAIAFLKTPKSLTSPGHHCVFLLISQLQAQTLTLTVTCPWRRREVCPSHPQKVRTMAGRGGVSSVHSAGQPRVRGSLHTPKVMGPSDPMGDQEIPHIPFGVTQKACYPLKIPGTDLLGSWGHHWAPTYLSPSSLPAEFCWLETQERPRQQKNKVRDVTG